MSFRIFSKRCKEYIHYFGDIYVPYGENPSRTVDFVEHNGKSYFDFTKTTKFNSPSFENWPEANMTRVRPDKMVDVIEKQEKEKLLALPVLERVKSLKETVVLHLKDFDSGEIFGYELTPYIGRFTHQGVYDLLRSLPESDKVDLLLAPTKEYGFSRRYVLKSNVYERCKGSKDIRNMVFSFSSENQEKIKLAQEKNKDRSEGKTIFTKMREKFFGRVLD